MLRIGVLASQNLQSGGKPPHSRGDLAGFFEIVTAVRLIGEVYRFFLKERFRILITVFLGK